MFKSGFVSILGRTNVGKSSIVNKLVGEKVAAVANKTQTTRTAIKAIINRPNAQIIFTDTPGIHKPKTKLGNTMVETAFEVSTDADVVLFVIEATSDEIGKGDALILEKIKEAKKKTILIINKVDLVDKAHLAKLIDIYQKEYKIYYLEKTKYIRDIYHGVLDTIYQKTPLTLFTKPMIYLWILIGLLGMVCSFKKTIRYWISFLPVVTSFLICLASPVNGDMRYMLPITASTILYVAFVNEIIYKEYNKF